MVSRPLRLMMTALTLLMWTTAASAQGSNPWYGLMQKPKNVEVRSFGDTFSIDLPKDWQLVPGHGATVFSASEKTKRSETGAAMVLEYMRLQAAFNPSIVDAVARIEMQELQALEPAGSTFTQQIYKQDTKTAIITQFDRPGLSGGKDHVVQYSLPAGTTMYHLIWIIPSAEIDKWKEMCAHVAASFKANK